MHVHTLLGHNHFSHQLFRRTQISHSDTWRNDFGKRAGVDYPLASVQRFNGVHRRTGIAQPAVGIIFQDHHIVLLRQIIHPSAARCAQRHPHGILEIWNRINELHALLQPQSLLQRVHIHALAIHRHTHYAGAIGAERVQGIQKSGSFRQNGIAVVQQALGREIQRLLPAGDHNGIISFPLDAAALQIVRNPLPQGLIPLSDTVGQNRNRLGGKHVLCQRCQLLCGKFLSRGTARGERDHPLFLRRFEYLADE